MIQFTTERRIKAPLEKVFETIADISNFQKAVPHITNVEFLTEQQSGVGTKFRETRIMKGKEESTELEVTELIQNEHIRIVADSHGTIWDTVMKVTADGDTTVLEMIMDATSSGLFPKILNRLIKGMIQQGLEQDMDAVKAYCENS